MIVSVNNTEVKMSKKALSGVKSQKNKKVNKKQMKKEKSEVKGKQEQPDINDPKLKKMRENRIAANKMKTERWSQIIAQVSTRTDLSDLHKQMLEKCLEPQFINFVPRKMKKKFVNFIILSGQFEAKYKGEAEKLFCILKTAEGSVPLSVRRRESRVKKALKKKLHKLEKEAKAEVKVKEDKGEKIDEDTAEGADVDMNASVKTEAQSESEDESGATGESVLKVKGRSKKNRTKLEKVGVKVRHLQGKLNKNKKGKGKDNKKRRNK